MQTWSLQHAKNRFDAVVESRRGEPQVVSKRGAAAVVVLAADEYARLKALEERHALSFIKQLLAIPRDGAALDPIEIRPLRWAGDCPAGQRRLTGPRGRRGRVRVGASREAHVVASDLRERSDPADAAFAWIATTAARSRDDGVWSTWDFWYCFAALA